MDRSALTEKDDRYDEMFSVERETTDAGHTLIADPYPEFARLRAHGAIYAGDIEEALTGHPNPQFRTKRPHYTTLSFNACSNALIDNTIYSSLHYHEMPQVMTTIGHTVLTMIGEEHSRHRAAFQPMMTRIQAMGWWREKWIEPFVDILVSDLAKNSEADLALQLCARLPMHTVTAGYGLGSDEALAFREMLLGSMSPLATAEQREQANAGVRKILLAAIAERRKERRDDLISRLIDAPFKDENGDEFTARR